MLIINGRDSGNARWRLAQGISMDSEPKSVVDKACYFPVDKNEVVTHHAW